MTGVRLRHHLQRRSVRAQVEGGLIYALGAAAWGEVVLGDGGQIITQNFDSYPVMFRPGHR